MVATLQAGREAIDRHAWDVAVELLADVDEEDGLSPDYLMLLGDAYWWSAQPDEAVSVFERAFNEYVAEGRPTKAAEVGSLLSYMAMRRTAMSVAGGWMARVEKLLEGQPESVGHVWYQMMQVATAFFRDNDLDATIRLADEAMGMAQRVDAPHGHAMALSFKGAALVYKGEWRQGVALVDEATTLAISAGRDLRTSSDVYCTTIGVCSILSDFRRSAEWTEQAERWMRANSLGGFTGVCQVHRAELKRVRGSWSEAEKEARDACVELQRFHLLNGLGFANYEIGEVRRRMGDLDAAEEAFMKAYEYGHPAQPGMALLMLDRGEVEEAVSSINAAVGTGGHNGSKDVLSRGHLLPAQIEILLAAGDLEAARRALAELDEVAEIYDAPTWEAYALACRGSLELSEGHQQEAIPLLDKAWRLWQQIELPYETARAREILGRARLGAGDERAAMLELRAARSIYEQLGAATDLRRVEEMGEKSGRATPAQRDRVTKVFMFTDIVTSTDLIGIIGDAAWERLLDWHDRALRESFATHAGEEVRHTGDGFFVAFESPRSAIDCAVSIQRRLAEHRVEHGFAPNVRIGLHIAEATRQRGDYSGGGVHEAARIGDIGGAEEIVASTKLLQAAGPIPYPSSDTRVVELKGIAEPAEVATIDWRL